jgi:hypothetical protein
VVLRQDYPSAHRVAMPDAAQAGSTPSSQNTSFP